jgi:glycosyltransferase involved in cell wall biosynthesis
MDFLVSVIIPAYNSEKYIHETIESVTKQTWNHIETIVVDDGSTDKTLEVLKQYDKINFKVLTQENRGACAARNYGFKQATGEFIQFLDADDLLSPNKIELQVKQLLSFKDYSNKLTHCMWGRFYDNIDEDIKWGPDKEIQKNLKPIDWLIYDRMSMTGCWLTPRALIEAGGLWDERIKRNQDGEFFSRLLSHAKEVLFCPEAKVFYRSGLPSSISANNSKQVTQSALKAIDLIKEYTLYLKNSERARLSMANKYKDFAFAYYIKYPDLARIAEDRALELGGANIRLQGGFTFKALERLLGWKIALKVKAIIRQFI